MTFLAVIIADDLTGALDTSTPFVEAGLTVAVAIEPVALAQALALNTDILAINTASRALSSSEAANRVRQILTELGSACPDVLFKKIDSRLKGNVAAESEALAGASGRSRIVVAPAIPDQARLTIGGAVTGRGVETPLPIRPLFGETQFSVDIVDALNDADLDQLVAGLDWAASVVVGARGLGSALARLLAAPSPNLVSFMPTDATLFAFGSRDPITVSQINHLQQAGRVTVVIDAPAGSVADTETPSLPAVIRCTGDLADDPEAVVSRFAEAVARIVWKTNPDMLMMGGGDTALAILRSLGATVLKPLGEIEAGVPWFDIRLGDGRPLLCAVKSGGFGKSDSLLKLIPENLLMQIETGKPVIDNRCGDKNGA